MTRFSACLVLSVLPLFGCELWDTPMSDPDCSNTEVDESAELVVAKPWLRGSPDARNGAGGIFSFAGQLAALTERYPNFDARGLWSLIGNDAPMSIDAAPFRLLALVNRTDLAEQLAPESPAGEARLVYTLTGGPGDAPSSAALPFTVIFEYSLGSASSARDWSAAFHALAQLDEQSAERSQATRDLVRSFVSPPAGVGAPYLSQLRVNDARGGTPELYELALDDAGTLAPRGLRNTPRSELAGSAQLLAFARDHAAAIEQGSHRVPDQWLAGSARVEPISWLSGSPTLERGFTRGTCSGCHGPDSPSSNGFHLSEDADGNVALSPFLLDEELPRRTQTLRARLCRE